MFLLVLEDGWSCTIYKEEYFAFVGVVIAVFGVYVVLSRNVATEAIRNGCEWVSILLKLCMMWWWSWLCLGLKSELVAEVVANFMLSVSWWLCYLVSLEVFTTTMLLVMLLWFAWLGCWFLVDLRTHLLVNSDLHTNQFTCTDAYKIIPMSGT